MSAVRRSAVVIAVLPLAAVPTEAAAVCAEPFPAPLLAIARTAVVADKVGPPPGVAYTSHDVSFAETETCIRGDRAVVTAHVAQRVGMAAVDGNSDVPEAYYTSGTGTFEFTYDSAWRLYSHSLPLK